MRLYSAFEEETLRTRRLVKDWAAEGFLSDVQRVALEADTDVNLRRTNGFLRLVLFLFTAGVVAAGVALVFHLGSINDPKTIAVAMFVFCAVSYGLAEWAVARAHLYRHGIEEALVFLSVLFLCYGLQSLLHPAYYGSSPPWKAIPVPLAGAAASFFIYRRFGYQYAVLGTLLSLSLIPPYITGSTELQRLLLAGCFTLGLILVKSVRRAHRQDYLNDEYGTLEAMLWLALYLTFNLQLTRGSMLSRWSMGGSWTAGLSRPFYWFTYAAICLLPLLTIGRALKEKDKPLLGVGIIIGLLTLVTNKPYLGWARHSWDPLLLGVFLIGVAMVIRRWLAGGADGVRSGFTAKRLSAADKRFMSVMGSASGLASQVHGSAPAGTSKTDFGGGRSGGGGASSSY